MAQVQESVDVNVPVRTAYNQWTQFESFPNFMDGVDSITQLDDTHNHWVTKVGGVTREFDTEITEQHPDERIAWKSRRRRDEARRRRDVPPPRRRRDPGDRSRSTGRPTGLVEKAGAAVGVDDHQVKADAKRFKEFIESRGGDETGAWRGEVDADVTGGGRA